MNILQDAPLVMGILNVTPDSFSDGGEHFSTAAALQQARRMVEEGASIIDVGGESTRPGADPVSRSEQIARVIPVIEAIRENLDESLLISIDTRDVTVARIALDAGASIINDVTAGDDPAMLALAAERRVPIVLMHMQGTPATMQDEPAYDDVVQEVVTYLGERAQLARAQGIAPGDIILDPGIGFGKNKRHNIELLAGLADLVALGYPVLLGTSRKRFMGAICRETVFRELVGATCATTVLGVQMGVKIFRVHDVRENRQAIEVALAVTEP